MAENAKKKNIGLIAGICCAVVVVAVVLIVVLTTRGGVGGLSDAFFVSDDSKYVLTLGSEDLVVSEDEIAPEKMHLVYFYSDEVITSEKTYYQFADEATAKQMYEYYKENNGDLYEEIALEGKYVIITSKAEDYDGVTATDIKQQIEFMEMIKNIESDGSEETLEEGETEESTDESADETSEEESTEEAEE